MDKCGDLDSEDIFRFAPELFDYKAEALEFLTQKGFAWFTDFNNIDVVHDIYGLEVEGIPNKKTAEKIMSLLDEQFCSNVTKAEAWNFRRTYQEYDGWTVEINKYPHPILKSWLNPDNPDEDEEDDY